MDVDVDVEVSLLGSLRVVRAGEQVPISSPRLRALLAELALAPGRPVSVATLVEGVWAADPPARARPALHSLTARLRKLIGESVVRTAPHGYLLDVPPEKVDVSRFLGLVAAADRAQDRAEERGALRAALAEWQGEPVFPDRAPDLVERYLMAVERLIDLDLEEGNDTGLLAELGGLLSRYPLREPLWERLIRALVAAGRGAEALASYADCRRTLADELGVEPGESLQRLHLELLAVDEPPATVRPRQLPRDIGYFTGRAGELRQLVDHVSADGATVCAIDGMAGVGKTTFAARAAHLLAEQYPDGQLWLDLHAHSQGHQPLDSATALDRLLRDLGAPGGQVPKGLDERAALLRTRLADRRVLIVLDNAVDSDQVRPLLPGNPACLVVVTSRRRLTGLDDARVTSLDVLGATAAVGLFERIAGERATARPADTLEAVELCGRLPLAIRIAASRLLHRPQWSVEHLVAKLRDKRNRLAELATGDLRVSAVLELSYQQLDDGLRALFRLLGVHPGGDIDAAAAGALAELSATAAEDRLQHLVDVNLLTERRAGRYRMHDLVHTYAAGMARADDAEAALTRLGDYYLHSAVAAMDLVYSHERGRGLRPERPAGVRPVELTGRDDGADWLATECANLIAVAASSAPHTVPMSLALSPFLTMTNRSDDAFALHTNALAVARRDGDPREARIRNRLSEACWRTGRITEATRHCRRAYDLALASGDRSAQAHATRLIGAVHFRAGDLPAAERHYRSAIDLAGGAGEVVLEGETWINLGATVGGQGRHAEAFECGQRATALAAASGDRHVAALALGTLGHACVERGDHRRAIEYLTDSVAFGERTDSPKLRAHALYSLGLAHHRLGESEQARDRYRAALDLARMIGAPEIECVVLMDFGELMLAAGHTDDAIALQRQAVTAADRFGEPSRIARARDRLGDAHHAAGEVAAAAGHWRTALRGYEELGDTEATARIHAKPGRPDGTRVHSPVALLR